MTLCDILKRRENLKNNQEYKIPVVLDDEVDKYIDWYKNNIVKGKYTAIGEYNEPIAMRNFIEKVAVWYELRYPDYEVNRLMPGSGISKIDIDEIMFENIDKPLNWSEFYSTKKFMQSLPFRERNYFKESYFTKTIYWGEEKHFGLTSNGIIDGVISMDGIIPGFFNADFKGMHIEDFIKKILENEIAIPYQCNLKEVIDEYDMINYQKEEMLNCIMYRIIERGKNRIGPRRAFLFAKEFNLDIDIPMKYGVDYSDPGLRMFVNEYLKNGGSKDLCCYVGYASRNNKYEKLPVVSVRDLVKYISNNSVSFYTPEEDELHQRLVNILSAYIDQAEENKSLETEKVKRLSL